MANSLNKDKLTWTLSPWKAPTEWSKPCVDSAAFRDSAINHWFRPLMRRSDFDRASRSWFWMRMKPDDSAQLFVTKMSFPTWSSRAFYGRWQPWDCSALPSRLAFDATAGACVTCPIASFALVSYEPAQCQLFRAWDQMSPTLAIRAPSPVLKDSFRPLTKRVDSVEACQDGDIRSLSSFGARGFHALHDDDAWTFFGQAMPSAMGYLRYHCPTSWEQIRFSRCDELAMMMMMMVHTWVIFKKIRNEWLLLLAHKCRSQR